MINTVMFQNNHKDEVNQTVICFQTLIMDYYQSQESGGQRDS